MGVCVNTVYFFQLAGCLTFFIKMPGKNEMWDYTSKIKKKIK